MLNNLLLLFLFLGFSSNEIPTHAIYLSTAKIDIQEEVIDIEIKVFTDDLQNAIRGFAPEAYEITTVESFAERHQKEIKAYFESHFQLSLNEKQFTQQYASAKLEGDVFLFKWTGVLKENVKSLSIKADYLMELFPTQSNVIQLSYGREKRFGRLKKGDEDLTIEFPN